MLDQQYRYGCEFYGATPIIAYTLQTDKHFLSLSQSLAQGCGGLLTGGAGAGKTETVKVRMKLWGNRVRLEKISAQ